MKTLILAALVAASLPAAPAFAQEGNQARIVIDAAGLDLATAEGRAALDLRVLHAARSVCGTPSPADARGRSKAETCITEARISAAPQRDTLIAAAERRSRPALASR